MDDHTVLDTIRDSYGRIVYSHKTHEKQREILSQRLTIYKWVRFVVIALTATGAVSVIFTNDRWVEVSTAVLGTLSLVITLLGMGFPLEKSIEAHRRAAKKLWHIRERYLHLMSDLISGTLSDREASAIRNELTAELSEIYEDAPDTSSKAYRKAQQAIQGDAEATFADREIDEFLPKSLKKTSL